MPAPLVLAFDQLQMARLGCSTPTRLMPHHGIDQPAPTMLVDSLVRKTTGEALPVGTMSHDKPLGHPDRTVRVGGGYFGTVLVIPTWLG